MLSLFTLPLLMSLSANPTLLEDSAAAVDIEPPRLALTLRISPVLAFPDVLSASLTVHAIPYVDIEAGVGFGIFVATAYARTGPRLLIKDWRDESYQGWTMRASVLAGYKVLALWETSTVHALNAIGALDWTYWTGRHLGFSLQLAGGAVVPVNLSAGLGVMPDLRLAIGLTF